MSRDAVYEVFAPRVPCPKGPARLLKDDARSDRVLKGRLGDAVLKDAPRSAPSWGFSPGTTMNRDAVYEVFARRVPGPKGPARRHDASLRTPRA